MSNELRRVRIDIVIYSETTNPGCCEIISEGDTYYSFGIEDDTCLRGVAIGISDRLQPFIVDNV